LNGVSSGGWLECAQLIESAGADALELNMYYIAGMPELDAGAIEQRYVEVLRELREHIAIPITMKLSPQFSSLPNFIGQLQKAGVKGVALFNRFYQPDIDLESLRLAPHVQLSRSEDALLAMRWIAILYGRTPISLAATGGVHTAEDAIKLILAGANVVHVCSTLLQQGIQQMAHILAGLSDWLKQSDYTSVSDMRGRISQQNSSDPAAFERASYLWTLDSYTSGPGVLR
jgi:dihydroorotate dehydrogenase (fumarate)